MIPVIELRILAEELSSFNEGCWAEIRIAERPCVL